MWANHVVKTFKVTSEGSTQEIDENDKAQFQAAKKILKAHASMRFSFAFGGKDPYHAQPTSTYVRNCK